MRPLAAGLFAATIAAVVAVVPPGSAALWPDAPDRVKADLQSPDVARRRSAAADLTNVPRKDAAPLIKLALTDSDVEVRLAAASAAARIRLSEANDLILPWLTDPAVALREAACDFFAKLPDPKLVKVLARSLGDTDPKVRVAAVRALGASGSSDAVAPLLARLDDGNSKVRLGVARALGKLGDKRAVTPLVSKIQDEASEVRQAVVRTLGELGDPKASPALVIALRDPAIEVRIEALSALSRLRAEDAVASIAPLAIEPTKKPGTADVRRAALAALGRIGTAAAIDAIVKSFGQYEDEKPGVSSSPARDAAIAAGTKAVPALIAVLEAGGTTGIATPTAASASAAYALGEIGGPLAGDAIVKAMRRGVVPLAVGLHALAALRDPAQLPVCLEHVAAADRAVRTEALVAAARMLDPEKPDGRAVEPLLASLDSAQTAEDRAEIALLLGRTGAARVAPVLVGLTSAKDEKLRLAAIDALGTLGAPAAGPKLLELLSDPSATVRLRAAIALGRAGGADVVQPTIARLSGTQIDRLAVVLAIGGLLERHGDAAAVAATRNAVTTVSAERDLLVVAIGRAKNGPVVPTLLQLLAGPSSDVDGRRAVAVALGARAGDPSAIAPLVALSSDVDATVRAQAAWSLGAMAGASELAALGKLVRDASPATAANAAASIGRVLSRVSQAALPTELCAALDDERPYVRANALSALELATRAGRTATCDDAKERKLLAEDANDVVRAAAARLLGARSVKGTGDVAAKARVALERCTLADPSGAVASICREAGASLEPSVGAATLVVFVAPDDGGPPVPRAPYAVERPDGLLHVGSADRRGAVVELLLGRGPVRLRVAAPPVG